jgi:glycine/D-amino acid oxidase-like deaminating enzyme
VEHLPSTDVWDRYGIPRRSALLSFGNLAADPRRLTAGYLNAAVARGARIYAPVTIERVESHRRGVRASTTDGTVIRARWLVFATGYELARGVPTHGHSIASTWVITTRPQPTKLWRDECFIWEASDPYLYLRTTADGRVICGGDDEVFSDAGRRDALLPEKTARLERRLAALFPQLDARADYAWCGSFGGSRTGTPSVGAVPRMPHCYAVLGFGGNGITFSMLAAQLIRGAISGTGDPDSALFSFWRRW